MSDKVRISFETGLLQDIGQMAVIYNPSVLPSALVSQVARFGVTETRGTTALSGRLKGTQDAFMGMIQSYGVAVDIVSSATEQRTAKLP